MMRPLSITFRLTLFFALASTAVLVAVGYLVASAVERHFVDLDRAELDGKLQLVRHLLARAGSPADLAAVTQALDDALVGHPGLSIIIVDRNDRVVFASSDTTLRPAVLQRSLDAGRPERLKPSVLESDGHAFRDIVGSVHTGMADHPPLAVAIAVNIDHQRGFLLALREKLWIAIASGVVLMTVLGWIAARRGLAPVRAMAALAQRISATHLDARLPPGSVPAELQGLAQAFDEMLERLAGSFRQLTDFSSDLAHEMRTPISNLVTQTEVALSRTRSPDEYREVLYSSLEEYERLTRMISDMLFLAKADDGTTVLHTEPVDLAAETNALFEFFAALADERDVTLVLEGGGRIEAERLMLRRAISNLLSNAIRHTPTGGEVRVEIRPLASGQVRFTVANPGEIPAEHLPRLFDRFYRVDASRHRTSEGAGLGLAITKSIVATHKGSIRVSSGGGMTRFEILWPGARAAAAGSAGWPGAKPSAGAADELARGGPPVLTQK
jgi:two-component system heavy metal sensor histidine kinase CusS